MDFKKILIAVDDSPIAEKVAESGLQIAKRLNAEVAIASIADTTFLITEGGVTPREMVESIKADLKRSHQLLIDKVFKDFKTWAFVEEGRPYEGILKIAEEWKADFIVIGTHGRTGLPHVVLGSVAEKTVRHSKKPVLVIPAK